MDILSTCPICSGTELEVVTERGDKFTDEKVNICMTCSQVFLSPRMVDLDDYYKSGGFDSDFRTEDLPTQESVDKTFAKMKSVWSMVKEHLPESGTLLDIGCGMGAFIKYAAEQFSVTGIEPSPAYLHWAKEHNPVGEYIVQGAFPDAWDSKLKFNVISLFHVLEHIPDPTAFLRAIHDRLAIGGTFILEYPDVWKATERQLLLWNYFQRSHLFDFNLYSIQPLLESIGFDVNQIVTFANGFPYDKNVLLICRKTTSKKPEWNSEFAPVLLDRLQRKIQSFWVSHKPQIQILHIASHNINVGDGAIIAGIRDFYKSVTDAAIEFISVDIVDMHHPDKYFGAKLINEMGPDLVLVGGGGTIDGHKNRVYTGTALNMPIEQIEQLDMPIAFCGLGHNLFRGQEFYLVNKLQQLIDLCDAEGFPFSVRRDRSLERLREVLDTKSVTRVSDPGFFLRVNQQYNPAVLQPRGSRPTAVFQITSDGFDHRFANAEEALEYFKMIGEVIEWMIEENGYNVVLALHTIDDLQPAHIVRGHVTRPNARYHLRTTPANVHPELAPLFFSTYFHANLVVGMRGHSTICAAGLRTPFVALSTHDKVAGFLDELDCSEYGVEQGPDFVERLKASITGVLDDPTRQSDLIATNAEGWAKELSNFAAGCLEII